jgi:hypothetical protein
MSSGRKIFRFLKFIEDIKQLYALFFQTPNAIRVLKALMCLSSFFYHLMDNVVWAVNVSIIDEYIIGEIRWKMTKKFFALIRKILLLIVDMIKLGKYFDKEMKFRENQNKIVENGKNNEIDLNLLNENFELRSKIRMKLLELVHSASRICMLSYSLKMEPFFSYTHPVYVAFCGILYSGISIFRHYIRASDFNNMFKMRPNNKIRPSGLSARSLERILMEDRNKNEILKENYFDNYYIDFNKDDILQYY